MKHPSMRYCTSRALAILAISFLVSAESAKAQGVEAVTIIEHVGSENPTTEGFTGYDTSGTGVSVGAILTPEAAWNTTDSSATLRPRYLYSLTANDLSTINSNGFVIEGRMRSPNVSSAVDNHAVIYLTIGTVNYLMQFGSNASGNAIVKLSGTGGGSVTLDSGGFHDYALVYRNGAGALYVDGTATSINNYTGTTGGVADTFMFGAVTSPNNGVADYATARLSSIFLGWRNVSIGGGGNVLGIVADPNTPNMFYMKTDVGGAYRWNAANTKWDSITDVLPQTLGGQYNQIESIAVDPNTAGTVYVSTGKSVSYAGEIWKSTNYGDTWGRANLKSTDFKVLGNVSGKQLGERMMVDPNNSNVIYYATRGDSGTRGDGLWKSTTASGTNSWAKVASFPATGSDPEGLSFVTFDKNGGTTTVGGQTVSAIFYVGVYASGSSGTVYRTADGGLTWASVSGGLTTPLRAQVASDGTLYVGYGAYSSTVGGVGKVARTGTSFTMVNPVTPVPASTGYGAIAINPTNPQTVYVSEAKGAYNSTTYVTTNGGNNWSVVTQPTNTTWIKGQAGIANPATRSSSQWFGNVKAMVVNPFNTSEVWVTDWLGVLRTADINAASPIWDYLYDGHEETVILDLKSAPLVSGSGAPLLSGIADVNGMRHIDLNVPPTGQYVDTGAVSDGSTTSLDFCEANANVWARVFDDFGSSGNGWLSINNGQNWVPFGSKPYSSARGGRIAVSATNAQNFVWAPESASTVYYTLNSGTTWQAATGLPSGFGPGEFSQGARPLASDRVNGKFYALKNMTGSCQIYRSTNNGATWSVASTIAYSSTSTICSSYKIAAAPGIDGEVWIALDKVGVYRSTDSCSTFNVVPNITNAGLLAFGAAKPGNNNPSVFFVGSLSGTSGIYRSDSLSSPSWVRVDDPTNPVANTKLLIEGDRQTFGRVYIGTDGRGIYAGDSN